MVYDKKKLRGHEITNLPALAELSYRLVGKEASTWQMRAVKMPLSIALGM